MLSEKEKLEHDMLLILGETVHPIGCGTLSALLGKRDYELSEATVGRLLRDFDLAGYTEKSGFQGRTLSGQGRARLVALTEREKRFHWETEFSSALKGHSRDQLLEVLVARRAIESELAALAAENATAETLKKLRTIVEQQRKTLVSGLVTADQDVAFHAHIADMANNRVLAAAIALIRQDSQLSPVLEGIRRHVHSMVYIDHAAVCDAIVAQDPETARRAMINHINNLILDVKRYGETTPPGDA